jgi:predicted RNase H-like HicB family nuclease
MDKIKKILPKKYQLIKHKSYFSIRIYSGKIDIAKGFDSQIETVKKAINNLDEIRLWLNENKIILFDNNYQ